MIIGKLKTDAEAKLGEKVTQAIITVPAYFNGLAKDRPQRCGQNRRTGSFTHHHEPTARRWLYGLTKNRKDEKSLVFDFRWRNI